MSGKRGAPRGNQNAAKGREWADMLRLALKTYEYGDVKRGQALRRIAERVVQDALDGDRSAIEEIGNRLDGKPSQALEHSGDASGFTFIVKNG